MMLLVLLMAEGAAADSCSSPSDCNGLLEFLDCNTRPTTTSSTHMDRGSTCT